MDICSSGKDLSTYFNSKNTLEFLVYDLVVISIFAEVVHIECHASSFLHGLCYNRSDYFQFDITDNILTVHNTQGILTGTLTVRDKSDEEIISDLESQLLFIRMLN